MFFIYQYVASSVHRWWNGRPSSESSYLHPPATRDRYLLGFRQLLKVPGQYCIVPRSTCIENTRVDC